MCALRGQAAPARGCPQPCSPGPPGAQVWEGRERGGEFPGAAVKAPGRGGGVTASGPSGGFIDDKIKRCWDAPGEEQPGGTGSGGHVQVGGTQWGGGDQLGWRGPTGLGGRPAGTGRPPTIAPTRCSVMEPLPSQCPPLPGSSHVPICPPRSSCVLAFVSQPCCRPAPISFCPINPRHESRRQKGCNLIRALLNPHCSPG